MLLMLVVMLLVMVMMTTMIRLMRRLSMREVATVGQSAGGSEHLLCQQVRDERKQGGWRTSVYFSRSNISCAKDIDNISFSCSG